MPSCRSGHHSRPQSCKVYCAEVCHGTDHLVVPMHGIVELACEDTHDMTFRVTKQRVRTCIHDRRFRRSIVFVLLYILYSHCLYTTRMNLCVTDDAVHYHHIRLPLRICILDISLPEALELSDLMPNPMLTSKPCTMWISPNFPFPFISFQKGYVLFPNAALNMQNIVKSPPVLVRKKCSSKYHDRPARDAHN